MNKIQETTQTSKIIRLSLKTIVLPILEDTKTLLKHEILKKEKCESFGEYVELYFELDRIEGIIEALDSD